jgi:hypothetical protein
MGASSSKEEEPKGQRLAKYLERRRLEEESKEKLSDSGESTLEPSARAKLHAPTAAEMLGRYEAETYYGGLSVDMGSYSGAPEEKFCGCCSRSQVRWLATPYPFVACV